MLGLSFAVNTKADATKILGGDTIFTDEFLCTASFGVKINSTEDYIVTAGHCLDNSHPFWKFGGTYIGTSTQIKSFNLGMDVGLIHFNGNTNLSLSNGIRISEDDSIQIVNYQKSIKDSHRGDKVCMVGSVSGFHCGYVKFKIPFTSYIWTDLKPLEGDSGGPIFTDLGNGKAELVGILSGHILGDMYFGHISEIFKLDSTIEPYLETS